MATIGEVLEGMAEQKPSKRQGLTPSKIAEKLHELGHPYPEQHTHDDDMYWPSWSDEFGTPELPEPTIQEGTMKGCVGKNSKNQPCQASIIPGTARCRYHTITTPPPAPKSKIIVVRRNGNGGAAAVEAVVKDSVENGTLIDVASTTYGRGDNQGKPRWFNNWRAAVSSQPSKYLGCHDVAFKDGKRIASRNIRYVRTTVPVQAVQ